MANIIKRTKTLTVLVKDTATKEDLLEVKRLVELGWVSKPCKTKVEKVEEEEHIIDENFNIDYDKVRKIDMVKYIQKFKDQKALDDFAEASHSNINGEKTFNKKGERKYNQIAAKTYFFKTFFPDRWVEIEKMLENRKFKSSKAKEINEVDKLLKSLLK